MGCLEVRARLALCAGGSVSDGIPELTLRPALIDRGG
jgi:hypothetical protein